MWINKRKYEDMQNKIKELNESVLKLNRAVYDDRDRLFHLMGMHSLSEDMKWDGYDWIRIFNKNRHDEPKATIGDIDNLTFTELAEYVINSKPITRIREHEVVVCPKKECGEDTNNDGNN